MVGGCADFGPRQLGRDQIAYSSALANSEKRQTLLNVIRLRYGDTPTFLDATQVISGYQMQRTVSGGFEAFPNADPSTYLTGTGTLQYQETPTFTYQPLAGEQYADSIIRPLSPATVLPLAVGGLPIDVLFRLVVQSVNGLDNATALHGVSGAGSPGFFLLVHDLRLLQIGGMLSVRFGQDKERQKDKNGATSAHVLLGIEDAADDPALGAIAVEARRLLGLRHGERQAEVVYGRTASRPGQVAILTRSMLAVLAQLGFGAEVPRRDILAGRTLDTIGEVGIERRPVVVIHSGPKAPADAFTSVDYQGSSFWIADDDFDSKLAFTLVQIIMALAATSRAPGTVITIPAG